MEPAYILDKCEPSGTFILLHSVGNISDEPDILKWKRINVIQEIYWALNRKYKVYIYYFVE